MIHHQFTVAEFLLRCPHASPSTLALNCHGYTPPVVPDHDPAPSLYASPLIHPFSQIPAAIVERRARARPLATRKAKTRHSGRFLVRITSFRVRLIDEDNLCEKYFCDCCRYAGILPEDSADVAKIEVAQVKVAHKADEKTVIQITPPDRPDTSATYPAGAED